MPLTAAPSSSTATSARSSPTTVTNATGRTPTSARPSCGSTPRPTRFVTRTACARSSPASQARARLTAASPPPTRTTSCRRPTPAVLSPTARRSWSGAGSSRAPSGKTTGPSSRPSAPAFRLAKRGLAAGRSTRSTTSFWPGSAPGSSRRRRSRPGARSSDAPRLTSPACRRRRPRSRRSPPTRRHAPTSAWSID